MASGTQRTRGARGTDGGVCVAAVSGFRGANFVSGAAACEHQPIDSNGRLVTSVTCLRDTRYLRYITLPASISLSTPIEGSITCGMYFSLRSSS